MLSVSILEQNNVSNTFVAMVSSETGQCDTNRKFRFHLLSLCLCELACLCQSVIVIDLCVCLSASLSLSYSGLFSICITNVVDICSR